MRRVVCNGVELRRYIYGAHLFSGARVQRATLVGCERCPGLRSWPQGGTCGRCRPCLARRVVRPSPGSRILDEHKRTKSSVDDVRRGERRASGRSILSRSHHCDVMAPLNATSSSSSAALLPSEHPSRSSTVASPRLLG